MAKGWPRQTTYSHIIKVSELIVTSGVERGVKRCKLHGKSLPFLVSPALSTYIPEMSHSMNDPRMIICSRVGPVGRSFQILTNPNPYCNPNLTLLTGFPNS